MMIDESGLTCKVNLSYVMTKMMNKAWGHAKGREIAILRKAIKFMKKKYEIKKSDSAQKPEQHLD